MHGKYCITIYSARGILKTLADKDGVNNLKCCTKAHSPKLKKFLPQIVNMIIPVIRVLHSPILCHRKLLMSQDEADIPADQFVWLILPVPATYIIPEILQIPLRLPHQPTSALTLKPQTAFTADRGKVGLVMPVPRLMFVQRWSASSLLETQVGSKRLFFG